MDLFNPQSGTIFWTVLTFVIVLIVLRKYAWAPILKTLEERENKISDALEQAESNRIEAIKMREEQDKLLQDARQESTAMIEESKINAEKISQSILDNARTEAEHLLDRARKEIELSKRTAIDELRQYAVDLSLAVAEKLTEKALSKEDHLNLIERSLFEFTHSK
ncbi:F0F1 ATP synthase subunit B [candidate division KSB1 bacterium]|nr:F0F1 ATP synthase subunit B [candidate division KSB1 bacterium]